MTIRYIGSETAPLYLNATAEVVDGETIDKTRCRLLWGDRVMVLEEMGSRSRVRARGKSGWVETADLNDTSLLELYFIDVGQGDGVLVRTPDHRHLLIDGGWPRRSQPTGKNAADFVDWKFAKDYGDDAIRLDVVLCSHNDQDHYGGLWDLLNPALHEELDLDDVRVERFYHAGLSWWQGSGGRTLGPTSDTPEGEMYTRLLGDRASALAAIAPGSSPALQGEWRDFIAIATGARRRDGQPTPIERLATPQGQQPIFLPGFDPASEGGLTIRVLAPVEFAVGGQPAIRHFAGGTSKNTNGNSILLRLDYGNARILLTGDLNAASQGALLRDYAGRHGELACDVAKSCHHGSDDISFEFMSKLEPAATIISSGDNEGHDHPRPAVVATSALTGHREIRGDRLITPLVYSTELARSVRLGTPSKLEVRDQAGGLTTTYNSLDFQSMKVTSTEVLAGARRGQTRTQGFGARQIVTGLIYGLVNVRTDGEKILCATLDEAEDDWRIETFDARF